MAHFAACAWYAIGQVPTRLADADPYDPTPAWIDLIYDFQNLGFSQQYIRSFYWVLGHLAAAPVDAQISPQNVLERIFTVSLILCSLLVLGVSISKMSNTVSVLSRQNAEAIDTKLKL